MLQRASWQHPVFVTHMRATSEAYAVSHHQHCSPHQHSMVSCARLRHVTALLGQTLKHVSHQGAGAIHSNMSATRLQVLSVFALSQHADLPYMFAF